MEPIGTFIAILLISLIILWLCPCKNPEHYVNSGLPTNDDITSKITVGMNYNDSVVSSIPNYPNDLSNDVIDDQLVSKLNKYKPGIDGPDQTPRLNKIALRYDDDINEDFTMMNPYNPNP